MNILLAVAAGGAIGAVGRYLVVTQVGHWLGLHYPFGTLAVNVIGSFLLAALVEAAALAWSVGEALRAFLVVGVFGAFTTFSAFSLEVVLLFQRGEIVPALLYAAGSVVLCVLAFAAGLHLVRAIL